MTGDAGTIICSRWTFRTADVISFEQQGYRVIFKRLRPWWRATLLDDRARGGSSEHLDALKLIRNELSKGKTPQEMVARINAYLQASGGN